MVTSQCNAHTEQRGSGTSEAVFKRGQLSGILDKQNNLETDGQSDEARHRAHEHVILPPLNAHTAASRSDMLTSGGERLGGFDACECLECWNSRCRLLPPTWPLWYGSSGCVQLLSERSTCSGLLFGFRAFPRPLTLNAWTATDAIIASSMTDAAPPAAASTEMVQLEAFEGSKENIQPSRTGYNPHKLVQSLTAQHTPSSDTVLASQRQILEQAILSYAGSDPLLPWLQYVDWTIASYPSLSPCSSLLPLLEKATRTFLPSTQYANDRRYIRLWLLYADRCPHPADIFAFMHAHAIGRTVSAFYVAWSRYNELLKRYQQAEDTLQLGAHCNAQPRNTLDIALRQLRARNEVRVRREVELMAAQQLDPLSDVVLNAMSDTQPRRVLSQLQQHDKENVAAQQQHTAAAQPVSSHRRPVAAAAPIIIRPVSRTQTPVRVYADTTTTAASTHAPPLPQLTAPLTAVPNWRHLPSRAAVDKENVLGSTTWNEPLRQAAQSDVGGVQQRPQPRYVVWKDEECERREREEEGQREERKREERARREKSAGMRRRMEAGNTAQATPHNKLTLDPLRNINKAASVAQSTETGAPTSDTKAGSASPVQGGRAALGGRSLSLNATAQPALPSTSGSALTARLPAHRLAVAPRR